jgi:hypothetical protein
MNINILQMYHRLAVIPSTNLESIIEPESFISMPAHVSLCITEVWNFADA